MKIAICAEDGCRANATCSVPCPGDWSGRVTLYCDAHAEQHELAREHTKTKVRRG